jgi:prefoldin beta subunit
MNTSKSKTVSHNSLLTTTPPTRAPPPQLGQANPHPTPPDLQTTLTARQKLESQQEENRAVQKEFQTLADDSTIYKLIGPVLLKQDRDDAKRTVDGRLEFIDKEIRRVEASIKELQGRGEKLRAEMLALQQSVQVEQQQGLPGKAGA